MALLLHSPIFLPLTLSPPCLAQIFRLPNVRRAPGGAGKLARFSQNVGGTECNTYLSANATIWPLPVSMSIVYDAE